ISDMPVAVNGFKQISQSSTGKYLDSVAEMLSNSQFRICAGVTLKCNDGLQVKLLLNGYVSAGEIVSYRGTVRQLPQSPFDKHLAQMIHFFTICTRNIAEVSSHAANPALYSRHSENAWRSHSG